MVIDDLLSNVRALHRGLLDGSLMREVLESHGNDIVEQQRIQLLEGKGSDGEDLRPYYTEDIKPRGYFRTRESAQRYAAWKGTLSYPYSVRRNSDAPNLYVTGVFHSEIGVEFGAEAVGIVPDTAYATRIMNKYGRNSFGLSLAKWNVIFDEKGAKDELIEKMRQIIWQ